MDIILSVILVIVLILSIIIVIKKRNKYGIKGIKSLLSSICLYVIAIINLFAYWFNFLGLLSWSLTIILLLLGAYFTKYIPAPQ